MTDTSGNRDEINIDFLDDATLKISPIKKLETSKDYRINMILQQFKNIAGNSYDTTYVFKFKTISGIDFTGLAGIVSNFDISKNPVLILQGINGDKLKYSEKLSSDGKFNFKRIEPGDYNLWCYYDTNKNNMFDYGWPFPFKPAEKFFYYKNVITLKPRWTLTDLKFEIK